MTTFLSDRAIYERVIRDAVPRAARRVWIATADIKDLYVETAPRAGGAVRRRLARRALPPLRTQGAVRRSGRVGGAALTVIG